MNTITTQWPNSLSDKTRGILLQLIYTNMESSEKREEWLNFIESASEYDADEIIKILSNAHS